MSIIQLPLRKIHYAGYLRSRFKTSRSKPINLSRDDTLGKFIFNRIQKSDMPQTSCLVDGWETVDINIPEATFFNIETHFIFFTRENVEAINAEIDYWYEKEFERFMFSGTKLGIEYKDLIEAFLAYVKVPFDEQKFEQLKKKDYRSRQKFNEKVVEALKIIGY